MATAPQNNIGASRLLGTDNSFGQSVSALTTQVTKLVSAVSAFTGGFKGGNGSSTGSPWNSNSNRSASGNGGGATFSGGSFSSRGRANGGGTRIPVGGNKLAAAGAGAGAILSGLAQYGNQNMSTNMQMDFFNTQAAQQRSGTAAYNLVNKTVFQNQYASLGPNDTAQASYINQWTYGNVLGSNGRTNPAFTTGQINVGSFAYANPTLGLTGGAQAAQQTYSARSLYASQAFGLTPVIGPGGVKASMGDIAQGLYNRTFGKNTKITNAQFGNSAMQGEPLSVNLNAFGAAAGWSSATTQGYQNLIKGQVAAQNKGISANQYYSLLGRAQGGDKSAMSTLTNATGMGSSMFENQRNLTASQTSRQSDILGSLAPAFDQATQVVNDFSTALTSFMKSTGLDKAVGTGAGWASPASNAANGLSNGFGTAAGAYGAYKLFKGGSGMFAGRTAASAASSAGLGARTAGGAYNITTLGADAAGGAGVISGSAVAAGALGIGSLGFAGWESGTKQTSNMRRAFQGAATSNPIGGAASKARQVWDKLHGNNSDSWLDIWLNPLSANNNRGTTIAGGGSSGTVGGSVGNGASNVGANAAEVIHFAETQLNLPYEWGSERPGVSFDCSGLTQWAYGKAGVTIPRVASDQQSNATAVDKNNTQPGDLLFVGNPAHHVVMNAGGGKIIEAPHTGAKVRMRALNPGEFTSAGRYIGSVGDMSSLLNGSSSSGANTLSTAQSRSGGDVGGYLGGSEASIIASVLGGSIASLPLGAQTASGSAASTLGQAVGGIGAQVTGSTGNSKSALQSYAKSLLNKYGWAGQWNSLNSIINRESGWDPTAKNPSSGAYGIPQSLPANKMASAGADWMTNGDTQLTWMMQYIKGRYGDPDKAWSYWQKNNSYASGAYNIGQDQTAQIHKGEMILPAKQAETVRSAIANAITNSSSSAAGTGGGITFGDINVTLPPGYSGSRRDTEQIGKIISNTIAEEIRIKNLKMGQ